MNNYAPAVRYLSSGSVGGQVSCFKGLSRGQCAVKFAINRHLQVPDVSHFSYLSSILFSSFSNFILFNFCHFVCNWSHSPSSVSRLICLFDMVGCTILIDRGLFVS
jgi:hypothetical protein